MSADAEDDQSIAGKEGHPLAVDWSLESTRPDLPPFLAPPPGAPVYYGFPVLEAIEVDGFKLGMITDFEAEPDASAGDAFVIAPDGSRAGLVWEVSPADYFEMVAPLSEYRWGVWAVTFLQTMHSPDSIKRNLAAVLPRLKEQWEIWQRLYQR